MKTATPEQISDKVPPEYLLGDKATYVAAVKASMQTYSQDGIVSAEAQKRSLDFLKQFEPDFKDVRDDVLAKTWEARFVQKSAAATK